MFLLRYLQKKYQHRSNLKDEDDESDLESVQSEEFEEMLNKMAGVNEEEKLDYMGEIGDSLKKVEGGKKKRRKSDDDDDEDEEEEEEDGLDDEEPPFSDDEQEDGLEATEEDLGVKLK